MDPMDENEWLAARFEEHRAHLRAVAYRMLGSLSEADDAVQDTWLRVSRAGTDEVENLGGGLTTIVARVCLNVLRSRNTRREDSLDAHLPDPVVRLEGTRAPEEEAVLADSVGLALLVVLDTLDPAERLAFVLHALFQAARGGEFDALVALLDPDVVLRADGGAGRPAASALVRGAEAVAGQAIRFALPNAELVPALVNGAAGVIVRVGGRPFSVMGFTVADDTIVEIDAIADPERVRRIAAAALD